MGLNQHNYREIRPKFASFRDKVYSASTFTTSKTSLGFTIVELLVVIVIIGILAAITITSYTGIQQRVSIATLQSDLKNASMTLGISKASSSDDKYPASQSSANLKSSPSVTLAYSTYNNNNSYCITATTASLSYYISSSNQTPTTGTCPLITFVATWGGTGGEGVGSITQTSDGGYVVVGDTDSYGAGNTDIFIAKYTSDGTLSWSKTWGGTGADEVGSMIQTSDSGYAVTGWTYSYGAGGYDAFIAKYTSDGTLSWSKTWGGTGNDYVNSIIQTSDGSYVVTGYTSSYGAGSYDAFIAKYTSSGTLSWSKTWGGTGNDRANSIIQTSDGSYAVAGYTDSYGAGSNDAFIAKYTSDGTLSWSKTWGGTGNDYVNSIIQTSDGSYAVAGYTDSYGAGSLDSFIAKYTSDGTLSWSKTWGGTDSDYAKSIIQTSDGGYTIAGGNYSYGVGGGDAFIAKYTSDGTLSWSKTWGGTGNDYTNSIIRTSDGGYAVTGWTTSYGVGGGDAFIAKYKSDGTINGCYSPMCQSVSPSVASPTPSVSSPTATTASPTPTITSPTTATVTTMNATSTVIVASQ
jgi:uncharacterized delta-60 repeat protein/prepilin-type N-terminal cleavage/methylation domain-containing protein